MRNIFSALDYQNWLGVSWTKHTIFSANLAGNQVTWRGINCCRMSRLVLFVLAMVVNVAGRVPAALDGGAKAVVAGREAAQPKYVVGLGEYQCFIINTTTGRLYGVGSNTYTLGVRPDDGTPGIPVRVEMPDSLSFVDVASGLHNSLAVDQHGEVWTWGVNEGGVSGTGTTEARESPFPVRIRTDSLGQPFDKVVQVAVWASTKSNGNVAVKSDGTVWVWGNTAEGMRGNGQEGQVNTRPVQVRIPQNKKIVEVVVSAVIIALASDGTVWTWGGANRKELLGTNTADFTHPHQLALPEKAKDIATGVFFSYALGVSGRLYGWGYYTAYMCMGPGSYLKAPPPPAGPTDLTANLHLPLPVASVVCNSNSTHVILTDGTLWGWGDNSCGGVGNGEEPDYAKHQPPYAWDWGPGEMMVMRPVRLAPGVHDFVRVFGGASGVFYSYAITATGQLYSWGRNKGAVLGNGIVGATPEIMSVYPNSWDVTAVMPVDPFTLTKIKLVTSPWCLLHPEGAPCNQFQPRE
jgi:alpha-tubulin suppressor-like RCC1 family protein